MMRLITRLSRLASCRHGWVLFGLAITLVGCHRSHGPTQHDRGDASPSPSTQFRTVVDVAGRTLRVSREAKRVLTFGHSFAVVAALAPEMLVARPGPFRANPDAVPYMPRALRDLPQLNTGPDLDAEQLKSTHFDLAVGWNTAAFLREQAALLGRIGLPVILVGVDQLEQYPATFRLLGQALGKEARAEQLAAHIEMSIARLQRITAQIPLSERHVVYYAEGLDGLTTQCGTAGRAEVLRWAGATNAVICEPAQGKVSPDIESHSIPVDIERLLALNPEVVVTRFAKTASAIQSDARWSRLRAVANKRVYAVPQFPFNWFDRPPSYMRIMGAQWLTKVLYPKYCDLPMREETRSFFRLFFDVTLSNEQLTELLGADLA